MPPRPVNRPDPRLARSLEELLASVRPAHVATLKVFAEAGEPLTVAAVAQRLEIRKCTASPRITELLELGALEHAGRAFDSDTRRNPQTFKLPDRVLAAASQSAA